MWNLEKFGGFVEGEGSFGMGHCSARGHKRGILARQFTVTLRGDDGPCLESMRDWLGYGTYTKRPLREGYGVPGHKRQYHHPEANFQVGRKRDQLSLVRKLDEYQWVTKKENDYLIWRVGIFMANDGKFVPRNEDAIRICELIQDVRKYGSDAEGCVAEARAIHAKYNAAVGAQDQLL